ncbi:hypothetical protein D3C83_235730 [compost metagenome]
MASGAVDIALAMTRRAYVMIKGGIALHEESAALARRGDLANLYFALAEKSEGAAPAGAPAGPR